MTLFPRFPRAPEFAATPHLRFTSRRILDARDLTNGIIAVMIDCMHGVTPSGAAVYGVKPYERLASHEPRAVPPRRGWQAVFISITESP